MSDYTARARTVPRTVSVVNVVATADMGQPLNLREIGLIEGGIYEPESYACAYLKRGGMAGKVTIFGSGKMISAGTKSVGRARSELQAVAEILAMECGVKPTRLRVKVRNIVAHVDLGAPLDFSRLRLDPAQTTYEPEVFPGMVWQSAEFPGTFLLFSSGKVVVAIQRVTALKEILPYLTSTLRLGRGRAGRVSVSNAG